MAKPWDLFYGEFKDETANGKEAPSSDFFGRQILNLIEFINTGILDSLTALNDAGEQLSLHCQIIAARYSNEVTSNGMRAAYTMYGEPVSTILMKVVEREFFNRGAGERPYAVFAEAIARLGEQTFFPLVVLDRLIKRIEDTPVFETTGRGLRHDLLLSALEPVRSKMQAEDLMRRNQGSENGGRERTAP